MFETLAIQNGQAVNIADIPILPYAAFREQVLQLLTTDHNHCVSYFAYPAQDMFHFICAIADDTNGSILLLSHEKKAADQTPLESLTRDHFPMHIYEREIGENYGVSFTGHPWLKPVRFAHDRADQNLKLNDYPFYHIESDELHEVGVGPIHAGVIEPGHFRFICNGEMVLHLEIQLGWQHRGIETLMLSKPRLLQRALLAESIAGDTAVGHALAFTGAMESLAGIKTDTPLALQRAIALELERIAIHTGDLSEMCVDVAYQLGSAAFGALRTPIINFTQNWCGNRLGKSLIRTGGSHFPLTAPLIDVLRKLLHDFEWRFREVADRTFFLPSVLSRFENIGTITLTQAKLTGAVGMAARMAGLPRDIRKTHPFAGYTQVNVQTPTQSTGDVFARGIQRVEETCQSIDLIKKMLDVLPIYEDCPKPIAEQQLKLSPDRLVVSLTEGWRGEICHVALTDTQGGLRHYKIKDPSMHNWMVLALALRDLEISDFPINNKSFNLSYCGFDL